MKKICIYAGSNLGNRPAFKEQALELGKELVKRNMELVYGGSCVGLMGEVANQVLALGGKVTGVMPRGLFKGEIVHTDLTELIEVDTMHQRKAAMAELADGFIALPGGYGTLEELFEAICWAQIGIHQKPVGVLNIDGFYSPLIELARHTAREGFMDPSNVELILSAEQASDLLDRMESYQPISIGNKWKQLEE
jgi:uncharacterized protein (TIGR00730 family)